MIRNQAEEFMFVLKTLSAETSLPINSFLECAEAVICKENQGEVVVNLPRGWASKDRTPDFTEFINELNQAYDTLMVCTAWINLSGNEKSWLSYVNDKPEGGPNIWYKETDRPGYRRPEIPDSLNPEVFIYLVSDSPFGVEWSDIPEKYKYLAVDYYSPEGGEGAVFAYQNKPYVPEVEEYMWSSTGDNIAEFIKVGSVPLDELPAPWYKCIAKRPEA
jgi:hypothetical protein